MKTDMQAVKDTIIILASKEPVVDKGVGLFVDHPILETIFANTYSTNGMINIAESPENFKKWHDDYVSFINDQSSLSRLFFSVRKSSRLYLLFLIQDFLSQKDLSKMLREVWMSAEFVINSGVPLSDLVNMFRKCDLSILMSEQELETFISLSNGVSIYRGVRNESYKLGLSWTLDKNRADWFANRFDCYKNFVYKIPIEKDAVLAYFSSRGEDEVVVDINAINISDIEKI